MKISAIKQQIKNPQRVSVFVDGKYSFSLSLDELAAQRIKRDQEVTEQDLKRLKKISTDGKFRQRALEWILVRPHSTREFKDYLIRKKAETEIINLLVEEFTTRGYLSDEEFARWFIELKQRKNKSTKAIRSELFKKGIDRSMADQFLEHNETDEEALREIIKKKSSQSRYRDPIKLTRYLTSQGFDYSKIKEEISNLNLKP